MRKTAILETLANKFSQRLTKMHSVDDSGADKAKYLKSVISKAPWKRTANEVKEVAKIVKEIPFFKAKSSLRENEVQYLVHHFRHRQFKAGTNIVNYGEPGEQFFIILQGKVKIMAPNTEVKGWKMKWSLHNELQNRV